MDRRTFLTGAAALPTLASTNMAALETVFAKPAPIMMDRRTAKLIMYSLAYGGEPPTDENILAAYKEVEGRGGDPYLEFAEAVNRRRLADAT